MVLRQLALCILQPMQISYGLPQTQSGRCSPHRRRVADDHWLRFCRACDRTRPGTAEQFQCLLPGAWSPCQRRGSSRRQIRPGPRMNPLSAPAGKNTARLHGRCLLQRCTKSDHRLGFSEPKTQLIYKVLSTPALRQRLDHEVSGVSRIGQVQRIVYPGSPQ